MARPAGLAAVLEMTVVRLSPTVVPSSLRPETSLLAPEPRPRAWLAAEQAGSCVAVLPIVRLPICRIEGGDVDPRPVVQHGVAVQREGAGVLPLAGAQRAA